MRPWFITAMRSERLSASAWSWVTKTVVMPTSRRISRSSARISSRSFRSRAASGSSSSRTRGAYTRARASAARCCMPPESWRGPPLPLPLQPDEGQRLAHAAPDLRLGHAALAQAEGHVLEHRHVGEERIGLKHHAEPPLVGRARRHVLAVDDHAAGARRHEARDQVERRRLPAARRAEEREQLALVHREVEGIHRPHRAEVAGAAMELDDRARHQRSRSSRNTAASPKNRSASHTAAKVRPMKSDDIAAMVGSV